MKYLATKLLNINQLSPDPAIPERGYDPQILEQLRYAFKANRRFDEPLDVRLIQGGEQQKYLVFNGRARLMVAQEFVEKGFAPAAMLSCRIYEDASDLDVLLRSFVADAVRSPITDPITKAQYISRILEEAQKQNRELEFVLPHLGISRVQAWKYRRLLSLSTEMREHVSSGNIPISIAVVIAGSNDADMQSILYERYRELSNVGWKLDDIRKNLGVLLGELLKKRKIVGKCRVCNSPVFAGSHPPGDASICSTCFEKQERERITAEIPVSDRTYRKLQQLPEGVRQELISIATKRKRSPKARAKALTAMVDAALKAIKMGRAEEAMREAKAALKRTITIQFPDWLYEKLERFKNEYKHPSISDAVITIVKDHLAEFRI